MMSRKICVYIAASLDGYIADSTGSVDWLDPYQGEDFGYKEFMASVDLIVMGRNSFDQIIGFGEWVYADKRTIVLTNREESAPEIPNVKFSGGDIKEISELIVRDGKGDTWVLGGAATVAQFLQAGLIDTMELFIIPILLGRGLRLFLDEDQRRSISLLDVKSYENGVVRLLYSVP
jgi:dihydrofolate reductase